MDGIFFAIDNGSGGGHTTERFIAGWAIDLILE
jgi:hypothetical protein